MKKAFANSICALAEKDPDIVLMCGDLGYGVLTEFEQRFPRRFLNAGICEQNMAAVASGMALEGKNVFIYSIGNFPTLRCIEQIRNDIAYHNANVTVVAVGAGVSYGALGMSHHATEDIAMMRAIPNMTVFTPCDPGEAAQATYLSAKIKGPCYLRLGRGGERMLHDKTIQVGGSVVLRDGTDVCILAVGDIAGDALEASDRLAEKNYTCRVISFPTVKPIDKDAICSLGRKFPFLLTLEEGNITGGFGSAVAEVLAENGINTRLRMLGIQDEFTSVVGSQTYLKKYYGMSADSIEEILINYLLNK
jgi:transketolase